MDAYRDLVTCKRDVDGPIPWDATTLYADKAGLETDVADLLWSVIRQMDMAERRWAVEDVKTRKGEEVDADI